MNKPFSPKRRVRGGLLSGSLPAAIAVLLVLALLIALRTFFPGALVSVFGPAWRVGTYMSSVLEDSSESDAQVRQLTEENTILRTELAAASARADDLTRLLGSRTESTNTLVAGVTARPPVSPYDVLVVDQGSAAGVVAGANVWGIGGTPIGRVTEVAPNSSRVTLFSTRGSVQAAWAGPERAPVELVGIGSGAFEAFVPLSAGVQVGDGVYLANGGAVPIGTVIGQEEDPSAPRTLLYVRPYTNPYATTWVTIERLP